MEKKKEKLFEVTYTETVTKKAFFLAPSQSVLFKAVGEGNYLDSAKSVETEIRRFEVQSIRETKPAEAMDSIAFPKSCVRDRTITNWEDEEGVYSEEVGEKEGGGNGR